MRIGIANEETWAFLSEIYDDLETNHQTSLYNRRTYHFPVFQERLNRYLFQRDLRTFLRSNDVVFFEWASGLLTDASILPKQCGIVTRLHRYEMYKWIDRINWNVVDKLIVVSEAKKREFTEYFPEQSHKVTVVYEAVDPEKFQYKGKKFNGDIGILCHLTPRKRVYELILSFSELIQYSNSLHLHIGGGPHHAYYDYYFALHDLVKGLNLQDKVTFYGSITEPSVWFQNIDIFISNSYSEGLQVSPLEAMASGCYCLSHRWAGADELLPEPYLYYTDRQMQEKIIQYCQISDTEKQQRRDAMRSIVCDKFNVLKTRTKIREIIESARM